MAAVLSGAVLAALLYDHANSPGHQEGLLLGQVSSHIEDTISDSQISNCKVQTTTRIYAYVPFPKITNLCGKQLSVDHLSDVTQGRVKEIVGWYKFRRNSTMKVSMRENSIYHKLVALLPGIHTPNFVFLLCTGSETQNLSTHSLDHSMLVFENGFFKPVSVSVVNLGETAQKEYKSSVDTAVNSATGIFQSVVNQFVPEFEDGNKQQHYVTKLQTMTEVLQQQLNDLCTSVGRSENNIKTVQLEVNELKAQIHKKKQVNRQQQPLPPSPDEGDVDPPSLLRCNSSPPPPYTEDTTVGNLIDFLPAESEVTVSMNYTHNTTNSDAHYPSPILLPEKLVSLEPAAIAVPTDTTGAHNTDESVIDMTSADNVPKTTLNPDTLKHVIDSGAKNSDNSSTKDTRNPEHFAFVDSLIMLETSQTTATNVTKTESFRGKHSRGKSHEGETDLPRPAGVKLTQPVKVEHNDTHSSITNKSKSLRTRGEGRLRTRDPTKEAKAHEKTDSSNSSKLLIKPGRRTRTRPQNNDVHNHDTEVSNAVLNSHEQLDEEEDGVEVKDDYDMFAPSMSPVF